MDLSQKTLTLCFSQGVSLKTWVDTGLYGREVDLYKRLQNHLGRINFITYGDRGDCDLAAGLNGHIHILPNRNRLLKKVSRRWQRALFLQHRSALRASDIVKTNQVSAAPMAIYARRAFGAKMITRCGYLWSYMAEQEGRDRAHIARVYRLEREAFEQADIGVVTTPEIRDMVVDRHDIDGDKLRVIPNYVNTDVFKPMPGVPKEPGLIAFVGRFEPQKNLLALLDAVAAARAKHPSIPYKLCLIGEGSLETELRQKAAALHIPAEFHARMPNHRLPEILNRAEAFVLVSRFEGHPKTSLEAMACGLPLIGTDITGIREEVEHKKTGYLCDTSAEGIARAISEVMGNSALRLELGEAGRRRVVERYGLDRILGLELDAIREALGHG